MLFASGWHAEARMTVDPPFRAFEQGLDTKDVSEATALVASIDARA